MRKLGLLLLLALAACSKRTNPPTATAAPSIEVPPLASPEAEDALAPAGPAVPKPVVYTGPYNVILVTVDSMRADMPWAGYERAIAPNLTALYARSTAYTHAYATSSFTSKSLGGLLSGRYPSTLDRTGVFFTRYLSSSTFFCELLEKEGIGCTGAHAHMYLAPENAGLNQGFEAWKVVPGIQFDYNADPYITSQKLGPMFTEMVGEASKSDKPFFAWAHFMDPHDIYQTHAESPHFGKRPRDLYDEEVFYADMWIGKFLDWVAAQPWAEHTVIAVSADHGELFGEHGLTRHAHEVWEELVHVPLFFYVPGASPRVIETARSHIDLAPTFMELLGAKADATLPGKSLVAELRGGEAPARDVISEIPQDEYNERRRTLLHGKYKLIAFGDDFRFSLFDIESDPREQKDLARTEPEVFSDMRARYKAASAEIPSIPPKGGIPKH